MAIFKPTNKYSLSTSKSLWNPPSIAPQRILLLIWELGLYYEFNSYKDIYATPEVFILFLKNHWFPVRQTLRAGMTRRVSRPKRKAVSRVGSSWWMRRNSHTALPFHPTDRYRALHHSINFKSIHLWLIMCTHTHTHM